MIRIPTSFPLLGHTITVKLTDPKDWKHGEDNVGIWDPRAHTFELDASFDGTKMEQTFLHELLHAVLDMIGHPLSRNEAFVDQVSGLLHQALSGAIYSEHEKPKPALKEKRPTALAAKKAKR